MCYKSDTSAGEGICNHKEPLLNIRELRMEIWLSVICVDLLSAVLSKRGNGLEIPQPSFIYLSRVCALDLNLT